MALLPLGSTGLPGLHAELHQSPANVLSYGADPTGVADSTTEVQAAIDAVSSGGHVFLPQGTYKTTARLDVTGGVTLMGQGPLSVINYTGSAATYAVGVSGLRPGLKDVKVVSTASGIQFVAASDSQLGSIGNVWVSGPGRATAGEYGISFEGPGGGEINYFHEVDAYVSGFATALQTNAGANAQKIVNLTTAQYVNAVIFNSDENQIGFAFFSGSGGNVTCLTVKANRTFNTGFFVAEPGGTSTAIAYEAGSIRNRFTVGANTSTIQTDAGSRNITNSTGSGDFESAATAAGITYESKVGGDAQFRYIRLADGTMKWGGGSLVSDVELARTAANLLNVNKKLSATQGIGVGNSAAGATLGTVVKKVQIFDEAGASIGYLPVYDAIT